MRTYDLLSPPTGSIAGHVRTPFGCSMFSPSALPSHFPPDANSGFVGKCGLARLLWLTAERYKFCWLLGL